MFESAVPPPPPPPSFCLTNQPNKTESKEPKKLDFASEFREAIDRLVDVEPNLVPLLSVYDPVEPQLQEGPRCGLVALNMAISGDPSKGVHQLYERAVERKMTIQGEMFSTADLASLAQDNSQYNILQIKDGLSSHIGCILNTIIHRGRVLIPYDAYHNHSPACMSGHKAHWTVASGFLICAMKNPSSEPLQSPIYTCHCVDSVTKQVPQPITWYNEASSNQTYNVIGSTVCLKLEDDNVKVMKTSEMDSKPVTVYLACRQGKSLHLGLWSFDDIVNSNNNLVELSPHRTCEDYIVPTGGPRDGLQGQAVLFL